MKDRQYVCSELKEEGTSMAFRDLGAWLKGLLNGGQGNSSRRPDGGTSCYRPIQRRNRQEEELAREKAAEYAAGRKASYFRSQTAYAAIDALKAQNTARS